jgi:hypothetical protein
MRDLCRQPGSQRSGRRPRRIASRSGWPENAGSVPQCYSPGSSPSPAMRCLVALCLSLDNHLKRARLCLGLPAVEDVRASRSGIVRRRFFGQSVVGGRFLQRSAGRRGGPARTRRPGSHLVVALSDQHAARDTGRRKGKEGGGHQGRPAPAPSGLLVRRSEARARAGSWRIDHGRPLPVGLRRRRSRRH